MSLNIGLILENQKSSRDDYFKILGCSENSTEEQIITEYRVRALKLHPDKNPGNEAALGEFQTLQEARDILTDPKLRSSYDKWRRSEICIPFKKWLGMNDRCATTMHWAKPKDQTMLEGCSSEGNLQPDSQRNVGPRGTGPQQSSDINICSRNGWKSDGTSNVYKEFRNYKI